MNISTINLAYAKKVIIVYNHTKLKVRRDETNGAQQEKERFKMTVKVYSTATCPWCDKAKEYLKSMNVEFETVDVSGNKEAAMELVKNTKQMGVPVIQVGAEYIVGYNPDAISKALTAAGILKA